jgi:hypothetical protein
MVSKKALLVLLPVALAGGYLVVDATREIQRLTEELVREEETGRKEGVSFVETLQGEHAELQLRAFDRRRELAMQVHQARRNRFLGLFAAAVAVLGLAASALLRRIAAELEEDRQLVHGDGRPPS